MTGPTLDEVRQRAADAAKRWSVTLSLLADAEAAERSECRVCGGKAVQGRKRSYCSGCAQPVHDCWCRP